jgi:hypothetical protein
MKQNGYLFCIAIFLLIVHFAYTWEKSREPLEGAYFTSGVLISSNGDVFDHAIRLQADEEYLYHYGQFAGQATQFVSRFTSGLLGSARFLTEGVVNMGVNDKRLVLDREILFNYSYSAKASSKITMYRLNVDAGSKCYYIRELALVRCLGRERIRK